MKLIAHNYYRSDAPSGENIAVDRQLKLLADNGIAASLLARYSDELINKGLFAKIKVACHLSGSAARRKSLVTELSALAPEMVHVHNLWPLYTYDLPMACGELGIPVVQTLHNFRLIGTNDRIIEAGRMSAPSNEEQRLHVQRMGNGHGRIAERVYRRALSRLWDAHVPQNAIDTYICLTEFQKKCMLKAGLPEERLAVLPNFLDHSGPVGSADGEYVIFVGRLDTLKGIDWLLEHWPQNGPELRVLGDGPLAGSLRHPRITCLGTVPFDQVQQQLSEARFLVMASTWYEGLPLVLVEALASGTPCLVPDIGALAEIISDGITGAVYEQGDSVSLQEHLVRLWDLAPSLRSACRQSYEAQYTPMTHVAGLKQIYKSAQSIQASTD